MEAHFLSARREHLGLSQLTAEVIISFTLGQLQDVAAATVPSMRGKKKRPVLENTTPLRANAVTLAADGVYSFRHADIRNRQGHHHR